MIAVNSWKWQRHSDDRLIYAAPLVVVALITGASFVGWELGWMNLPYMSPYVAAAGLVAHRVCIRAGLIVCFLTMPIFNFCFSDQSIGFNWPKGGELAGYISMFVLVLGLAPRVKAIDEDDMPKSKSGTPLPFVSKNDKPNGSHGAASFWTVDPTGEWAYDCRVGAEYFRLWFDLVQKQEPDRPLLCWIIRDMVRSSRFTGVEAGFIQSLAKVGRATGFSGYDNSAPDNNSNNLRLH